jgi:putative alpha-1,2-mannosidase
MSAWYVFSALGLYPTVPTRAELALTSPLFPTAVLHLGSGKDLTINTEGTGVYVQKLTVGGKSTTKGWLPASTVSTGGKLVYTLGGTPNRTWGSGPSDVPPQN